MRALVDACVITKHDLYEHALQPEAIALAVALVETQVAAQVGTAVDGHMERKRHALEFRPCY